MARWRAAQVQEAGGPSRERRPFLASECQDLPQAQKWRLQIVSEIAKKVAQIQNGSFFAFMSIAEPSRFSFGIVFFVMHSGSRRVPYKRFKRRNQQIASRETPLGRSNTGARRARLFSSRPENVGSRRPRSARKPWIQILRSRQRFAR